MDKITDFFKEVKERLSNPFLYSFLFSWLIFNWTIIVGLFFYSISELKRDGYESYIDLISKNLSTSNTVFKPLLIAIAYTFLYPFLRNTILAFNSWTKAWGNDWILRLTSSSKVSMSKYIELREVYEKRTLLLEDILKQEGQYLKENEEIRNENLKLSSQFNSALGELQKMKDKNDLKILSGNWEATYNPNSEENKKVERVWIDSSRIVFYDNQALNTSIRMIQHNTEARQLHFVTSFSGKDKLGNEKHGYHYYTFDVLDEARLLKGREDESTEMHLKKLS